MLLSAASQGSPSVAFRVPTVDVAARRVQSTFITISRSILWGLA